MNIRTFALSSAAALTLAAAIGATPALAFTHHPATPEEVQQTDALNAQALANAQGQAAAPAPMTTAAAMPVPETDATAMTPPAGATPLKSLTSVPPLANAIVQGANGTAVGTVKNVVNGIDGKPTIVDVALNDNAKVVAISANELSFDTAHNVLIASLTDEQIKALPPANG